MDTTHHILSKGYKLCFLKIFRQILRRHLGSLILETTHSLVLEASHSLAVEVSCNLVLESSYNLAFEISHNWISANVLSCVLATRRLFSLWGANSVTVQTKLSVHFSAHSPSLDFSSWPQGCRIMAPNWPSRQRHSNSASCALFCTFSECTIFC